MKKKLIQLFGRDDDKLIHIVTLFITMTLSLVYAIIILVIDQQTR